MILSSHKGDNMYLQKANEYTSKLFSTNWVTWVHEGTKPAENNFEKSANALTGSFSKHCAMCLNLNGCCFVKEKCPPKPLHPNCHCYTIDIPSITARAESPIEKFTKYIFAKGNSKKQLFELWGYDIMNSQYLQKEFINQAKLSYSVGYYALDRLDDYGQRINIEIKLKRKDKEGYVTFQSGWMVYPNGKIILTTPYGDK